MLKHTNKKKEILSLILSWTVISLVCTIFIFVIHNTFDNNGIKLHIMGTFFVTLIFLFPIILSMYFSRKRLLVMQCLIALVIIGIEIALFLSTLYMAKIEELFIIKLCTIVFGAIFLPIFYSHFIKRKERINQASIY